jgi:hypothetical protein
VGRGVKGTFQPVCLRPRSRLRMEPALEVASRFANHSGDTLSAGRPDDAGQVIISDVMTG